MHCMVDMITSTVTPIRSGEEEPRLRRGGVKLVATPRPNRWFDKTRPRATIIRSRSRDEITDLFMSGIAAWWLTLRWRSTLYIFLYSVFFPWIKTVINPVIDGESLGVYVSPHGALSCPPRWCRRLIDMVHSQILDSQIVTCKRPADCHSLPCLLDIWWHYIYRPSVLFFQCVSWFKDMLFLIKMITV